MNAEVRARVLGLPMDGSKRIVLIERDEERAKDWLRQSRELSGGRIRYRMHLRAVSAEGISTHVNVVVAWWSGDIHAQGSR